MNTTFTITVELTQDDIKQAVAEYVEKNLNETSLNIAAKDVSFQVSAQTDMRGESYGYYVKSARIAVKKQGGGR